MPHFLVTVAPRTPAARGETVHTLYLLSGPALSPATVARLGAELLHDPVVQQATWTALERAALAAEPLPEASQVLEIAYRPGVTDNEGEMVLEGARRLELPGLTQARALRRYLLPPGSDPATRAAELAIDLVQTSFSYAPGTRLAERLAFYHGLVTPPEEGQPLVARVPLRDADDEALLQISQQGVLALDLAEMRAIRDYFAALGRDPTDGELETIAQTWSEHCSHKSFKARVHYQDLARATQRGAGPDPALHPAYALLQRDDTLVIDSLIRTFLIAATERIVRPEPAREHCTLLGSGFSLPAASWVRSAFVDNAGIIAFTADYEVSFKVETHNHPSALEPFGGANTGVGGVIRDVLGVSAEPIANTDVLCFGMPDTPPAALLPGVLHPTRVATGVVAGVRDYGNKLGIPTVNGAVLFDPGYTANPLVYCGTLGIAPRGLHPRNVQPGDAIVLLGGRTGRDGIHGATFSSIELTHQTAVTVGSAVQIGDPITEKKLLDVLLQARDARLYSAITDCGAGGLSSAVGEMGAACGASVELSHVPRKYAGLQPWEVWLSEAQERMVLAVPPANVAALLALCAAEDVAASVIGSFTADGQLRVTNQGVTVVELAMAFLHDGRPQRVLEARWAPPDAPLAAAATPISAPADELLLRLLAHPNIASKERIVRTYDHEVRGATLIKPLVGARLDGPGDAAVLQPLPRVREGLALGCGINPRYGRHDPYWMALSAVDEALRNVVAVGGDPERTAILDNFCWGDPRQPDRMAGLVRAAAGCYDAAVAFGTPFISGKDSLNNEYREADGTRVAIPPTLLISALAHVPDVDRCVTMDLKTAGNVVYLIGETRADLLGSHLEAITGATIAGATLPQVDLAAARHSFAALHRAIRAGLVRACHDLSEGGLAVAAAEMVIAGDLGLQLDLAAVTPGGDIMAALFSETPSRFLVEVPPDASAAFEAALAGVTLARIGTVTAEPRLQIHAAGATRLILDGATLRARWQSGLDGIGL
ncbi:MAG: phosphoribosylformylglycinamidine synthase subunit PurL [Chloroflexi bacterium]|nr:phosphoribosylformylglycinamidine synthase subunit PurL [Chloroflexota bacterium]